MTTKTHNFIDLPDLIGMKIECAHCHLVIVVPLEKADRYPLQCPNCNELWGKPAINQKPTKTYVDNFVSALAALKREVEGDLGFTFSLEVSGLSSGDKD